MEDLAFPLLNSVILGSVIVIGAVHLYRFYRETR